MPEVQGYGVDGMKHSTGKPTKAEQARIDSFRHIGCIVSRVFYGEHVDYDVHHLTDCGRRLGHAFTIPLSPWYHRGVVPDGLTHAEALDYFGPSLALSKLKFIQRFSTERQLLAKVNELLEIGCLAHPV